MKELSDLLEEIEKNKKFNEIQTNMYSYLDKMYIETVALYHQGNFGEAMNILDDMHSSYIELSEKTRHLEKGHYMKDIVQKVIIIKNNILRYIILQEMKKIREYNKR